MKINSLLAIVLLSSLCRASTASQPVTTSPAEVLRQCQTMYAALHSYSETANVTVHSPSGVVQQRIQLRVMKPNYLFISVTAEGGTREVCSNGKQFTVYAPSVNRYTMTQTAPTLPGVLKLLAAHAQMGTILNGLYFVAGGTLPHGVSNLRLVRTEQVKRHEFATVTAVILAGKSKLHAKSVDVNWTWFINTATHEILRTDALSSPFTIIMPILSKSKGKMVGHSVKMHVEVHSTVVKAALNPSLLPSAFVIHMKPGAQRVGSLSAGR